MTVELYSFAYLEDTRKTSDWSVYPSKNVWAKLMGREASARWIGRLTGTYETVVSVGLADPIEYESTNRLYCPFWILDALGVKGDGEEVAVEWVAAETLERATRLVFSLTEALPADLDPRDLLEGPLSMLGVIRTGSMLPIPGMEGECFHVTTCEPADEVFLDGDEIALEFLLPEIAPAPLPSAPLPSAPSAEEEEEEEPWDDSEPMIPIGKEIKKGFVPFSGVGRRLCD